ncbi:hypothetical protein OA492_03475 [Pelagibacteraceae bacterium]|nr:hypothetical protein [Pelagibacteraceae bacterium]
MVKTTLIYFIFIILTIISKFSFADPNIDQWLETDKTYKDLVNEGYEVKSYSISNIQLDNGMLILFVTVLQKDEDLFECQEYQTMDQNLDTLDMNLICKQLVQPYQRGIGT